MAQISKDSIIGEIIEQDRGVIPILMNAGMHCVGCPASQGESIAEAGFVHGMEVDKLVEEINEYLSTVSK